MCKTNFIKSLFPSIVGNGHTVMTSINRSDGQVFKTSITLLTKDEAIKVKDLIQLVEELRTCDCGDGLSCQKHRR